MQTIRQQIIDLLQEQEFNAREISQALSIMEKEVYDHLEHIDRTICRQGMRLVVQPYACLSCGFTFEGRRRWTPRPLSGLPAWTYPDGRLSHWSCLTDWLETQHGRNNFRSRFCRV